MDWRRKILTDEQVPRAWEEEIASASSVRTIQVHVPDSPIVDPYGQPFPRRPIGFRRSSHGRS